MRSVPFSILVLILGLAMLMASIHASSPYTGILYYEYGMHTCPHCRAMTAFLEKNYPDNYFFCDIASSPVCAEYFEKYLNETGLPGYVPQVIVVRNMSYVLAIVIGEYENKTFFDGLANLQPSTKIPIYEGGSLVGYLKLKNMTVHRLLISLLYLPHTSATPTTTPSSSSAATNTAPTHEQRPHNTSRSGNPVAYLVPLALSDSVNPCTIAVYATLLATVSVISRKRAMLTGVLFIIGVFAGYTALGLGIAYGLSLVRIPQQLLSVVLIVFGTILVLSTARKEECRICREGSCGEPARFRYVHCLLNRAVAVPVFALLLGLLLSLTLLPCSMGPYIVYLLALSQSGAPVLPYILLYNLVFCVPLYIVLASVLVGRKYADIDKYRKWIYVVAGTALIIMGLIYFIA